MATILAHEGTSKSATRKQARQHLARLSQQLTLLEKRDFEQWVIVVGTGILVAAGLVAILFPSAILAGRCILRFPFRASLFWD